MISRTPTELINFMKQIGTDTLVVFTLQAGWRMETKVTWTSVFHDFSRHYIAKVTLLIDTYSYQMAQWSV
jgi:hypothetical protein